MKPTVLKTSYFFCSSRLFFTWSVSSNLRYQQSLRTLSSLVVSMSGFSFGAFATSQPSQLGFGFGSQPAQTQQQQQLLQQQQQQQLISNLFAPKIYNDERDNIIGMFNSVQAFWGTGKAFYSVFNPPHQFSDFEQYNRFKTIVYSVLHSLSKEEVDHYLNMPPKGIDERIWTQAKLENADPSRFTPLPLIGFNSLNNRFQMQEKEIQQQQMKLKQIIDNVTGLESDIAQFKAKFEDCRRKHAILSYQVLKKMISQEMQRKRTLPIQEEEDKLRANLEAIQSELNVPTKFQGCLNELMSLLRQMQCQSQLVNTITPDKNVFNEYKQFLREENAGIMSLVDLFKKDVEDINRLTNK